jgi:hypothetical protein
MLISVLYTPEGKALIRTYNSVHHFVRAIDCGPAKKVLERKPKLNFVPRHTQHNTTKDIKMLRQM